MLPPPPLPGVASLNQSVDAMFRLLQHEVAHVLGFSASSFPLFRDRKAGGRPRTPRVGGSLFGPVDRLASGTPYGISPESIDLSDGRGAYGCNATKGPSGCAVRMRSPAVALHAQRHFACDTLPGAELEDGAIIGSHWETRLFNGEVMTPIMLGGVPFMSEVTLALFEDSGWYIPAYSAADSKSQGILWGRRQGCEFATGYCLTRGKRLGDAPVPAGQPPHFCAKSGPMCTLERHAKGDCGIQTYKETTLAPRFRYFNGTTTPLAAGTLAQMDYCPYVAPRQLCASPTTRSDRTRGEITGLNSSLCFESTLLVSGTSSSGGGSSSSAAVAPKPVCYVATCAKYEGGKALNVSVDRMTAGWVSVLCRRTGQELPVPGFTGVLVCPDVDLLCTAKWATCGNDASDALFSDAASNVSRGVTFAGWLALAAMLALYTPLALARGLQVSRRQGSSAASASINGAVFQGITRQQLRPYPWGPRAIIPWRLHPLLGSWMVPALWVTRGSGDPDNDPPSARPGEQGQSSGGASQDVPARPFPPPPFVATRPGIIFRAYWFLLFHIGTAVPLAVLEDSQAELERQYLCRSLAAIAFTRGLGAGLLLATAQYVAVVTLGTMRAKRQRAGKQMKRLFLILAYVAAAVLPVAFTVTTLIMARDGHLRELGIIWLSALLAEWFAVWPVLLLMSSWVWKDFTPCGAPSFAPHPRPLSADIPMARMSQKNNNAANHSENNGAAHAHNGAGNGFGAGDDGRNFMDAPTAPRFHPADEEWRRQLAAEGAIPPEGSAGVGQHRAGGYHQGGMWHSNPLADDYESNRY
eukprot:jgi/Mesvir1/964/Mv17516-RA.2